MERLGRCLISYDTKKTIKEDRVKSGRERKRGMAKKATLRMLLCFRSYENWFIFPRRWRICIHFSQRINKWEKIWSLRHLPSVEMRKTEERGRARKSARGPIRGDNPWRQTSVPLRSSSWRGFFFVGPVRYHIIHTREEFRND